MSAIEKLSYANYEINLQRLEGIKLDQNEDNTSLFSSSLPINNFLFGGDSKTLIKRIKLSKKATRKSSENTIKKYFLVQLRRAGTRPVLGPKVQLTLTARLYDLFLSMAPKCSITNFKITSVKTLRGFRNGLFQ